MNTFRHWFHYRIKQETTVLGRLNDICHRVGSKVIRWLNSSSDLRIWQTKDRKGHISWHIYNPITGQSIHLSSEQEVRIWIDQQYYRH